mgnify:CR=1 FL=1
MEILKHLILFVLFCIPFLGLLWLMVWLAIRDKVAYLFSSCGIIFGIFLLILGWVIEGGVA